MAREITTMMFSTDECDDSVEVKLDAGDSGEDNRYVLFNDTQRDDMKLYIESSELPDLIRYLQRLNIEVNGPTEVKGEFKGGAGMHGIATEAPANGGGLLLRHIGQE